MESWRAKTVIGVSLIGLRGMKPDDMKLLGDSNVASVALTPSNLAHDDGALFDESELQELKGLLASHSIRANSVQGLFFGISSMDVSDIRARVKWLELVAYCLEPTNLCLGAPDMRIQEEVWFKALEALTSSPGLSNLISVENICPVESRSRGHEPWTKLKGTGVNSRTLDIANALDCSQCVPEQLLIQENITSLHLSGAGHEFLDTFDDFLPYEQILRPSARAELLVFSEFIRLSLADRLAQTQKLALYLEALTD